VAFLPAKAATALARFSHRNSVRPSVRLSVYLSIRVGQSKTVQAKITESSLLAAWKTLVLESVKLFHKFERGHPHAGALNERGVEKICDFQPISRHVSERVRDRA